MLESKTKFIMTSPQKERTFSQDGFYNWSNNHMYRTSYNDMATLVSFKSLTFNQDTSQK